MHQSLTICIRMTISLTPYNMVWKRGDGDLRICELCLRPSYYQSCWAPTDSEWLPWEQEEGNDKDPYAVVVLRGNAVVSTFQGGYQLHVRCFFSGEVAFTVSSQEQGATLVGIYHVIYVDLCCILHGTTCPLQCLSCLLWPLTVVKYSKKCQLAWIQMPRTCLK